MFGRRPKETDQLIVRMERQLDLIYTALVVRDPGTSISADAYEGLRKQVIAAATARQAHVAQLAEFDVALTRGASAEDLRAMVSQWLDQAGVARVEDAALREAFDSSVPSGVDVAVEIPAYVNTLTGQLVRQGRLRARPSDGSDNPTRDDMAPNPAPHIEPDAADETGTEVPQKEMEAK